MQVTVDLTRKPIDVRVYRWPAEEIWRLEWWPTEGDGSEQVAVMADSADDLIALGEAIIEAVRRFTVE